MISLPSYKVLCERFSKDNVHEALVFAKRCMNMGNEFESFLVQYINPTLLLPMRGISNMPMITRSKLAQVATQYFDLPIEFKELFEKKLKQLTGYLNER